MKQQEALSKEFPNYQLYRLRDYHLTCKDFIMPFMPMSMRWCMELQLQSRKAGLKNRPKYLVFFPELKT